MNYIEVRNLKKSFKDHGVIVEAVRGISFEVKQGEILGLLGPNGAGKSTTINMLTGLVTKDSGEINILGLDPDRNWETVKNSVNVVTAYEKLSEKLTVWQNLRVYGMLYNVSNLHARINQLAGQFGILHLLGRMTSKLSSGEHTRVVLVKSLLNEPRVIFMDECTVGLDPDIAERTRRHIIDYNRRTGCAILFTSHYMYEIEELCRKVVFMQDGKIIKIGTPKEIKRTMTKQTIELGVLKNKQGLLHLLKSHKLVVMPMDANVVKFEIDTDKHNLQKLLGMISDKGVEFSDMHIYKPSLDDFFIELARGKGGYK